VKTGRPGGLRKPGSLGKNRGFTWNQSVRLRGDCPARRFWRSRAHGVPIVPGVADIPKAPVVRT
jgi:hypothetical protein